MSVEISNFRFKRKAYERLNFSGQKETTAHSLFSQMFSFLQTVQMHQNKQFAPSILDEREKIRLMCLFSF